ncbi:MAG: YrzE family protein [Erysipelotrichaceae bacterium]|nr:YrzE family protein [Erysipelotrichaceae bacterium]
MKDRSQNIGWFILFLIASGFFGFISANMLVPNWGKEYLICSGILTFTALTFCFICFHFYQKKQRKEELWEMLNRGCYRDVERRINENSREMKYLWELKLLALFHCGDSTNFKRLYQEYMNDINECSTLGRYILGILKDLETALTATKAPVAFFKETQTKKKPYTKRKEYALYQNLRQGIEAYYGTDRHMVKIYFEKFLMQTEALSKPLGWHLYFIMTRVLFDKDHPQWEEYLQRTQQFVYDERSKRLIDTLKAHISKVQKGTGYQQLMDREFNRNNQKNSFGDSNASNTERSFDYQQPGFRRNREDANPSFRRHSSDVQRDFDEMNKSLSNDPFPMYEDNTNKRNDMPSSVNENMDLDPTWFARKPMDESRDAGNKTSSFSRRSPSVSQSTEPRNNMNTDPFLSQPAYQEPLSAFPDPQSYPDAKPFPEEEPSFLNQRSSMNESRIPMEDTQSQPNFNRNQMDPEARFRQMEEPKKKKKEKKKKEKKSKRSKNDAFDFDNTSNDSYAYDDAKMNQATVSKPKQYKSYVKQNLTIFFITLLDAAIVSFATSSIVYTAFFNKFSNVSSDIVPTILIYAGLITLFVAYITASLHTGYTILKKPIRNWNTTVKIIFFPLIFVIALIIGIICEIPYLIFASIKAKSE